MKPALIIRPAYLADAVELGSQCWPERPNKSVHTLLHRAEKLWQQQRGLGAVAIKDSAICGFGMLTLWPRTAEISDLIVAPGRRGQGIGTAIITYLEQHAEKFGATHLEIGVALSNPRALALYRRLGFEDFRTLEIDLGHGPEPVLYLLKPLASRPSQRLEAIPR